MKILWKWTRISSNFIVNVSILYNTDEQGKELEQNLKIVNRFQKQLNWMHPTISRQCKYLWTYLLKYLSSKWFMYKVRDSECQILFLTCMMRYKNNMIGV